MIDPAQDPYWRVRRQGVSQRQWIGRRGAAGPLGLRQPLELICTGVEDLPIGDRHLGESGPTRVAGRMSAFAANEVRTSKLHVTDADTPLGVVFESALQPTDEGFALFPNHRERSR